jgi:hypothetical protein
MNQVTFVVPPRCLVRDADASLPSSFGLQPVGSAELLLVNSTMLSAAALVLRRQWCAFLRISYVCNAPTPGRGNYVHARARDGASAP